MVMEVFKRKLASKQVAKFVILLNILILFKVKLYLFLADDKTVQLFLKIYFDIELIDHLQL